MTALAVPIALLLGLVAELGAAVVFRLVRGSSPWFRPARDMWRDGRRLVRRRDRASALELLGTATALTGAGIAAAAAMGTLRGSIALVYPALVLAAAGGYVSAFAAPGAPAREAAERARRNAVLAEPGYVIALGAGLLRWSAFDLDAVRGAQQVLGPGIAVGPAAATAGLIVAVVVLLVAGGSRLPPLREGRGTQRRPAGSALAAVLCRWSAGGATAMVAGVLLAGGSSLSPGAVDAIGLLWWSGAALLCAVALGAAHAAASLLRPRLSAAALALAVMVLGAAAAALVALG